MRRQQKIREQKKWEGRCFLLIIAALSLLKLWLVQGLVIHPLPSAMCDDVLLRDWATSIAGGECTLCPVSNEVSMGWKRIAA